MGSATARLAIGAGGTVALNPDGGQAALSTGAGNGSWALGRWEGVDTNSLRLTAGQFVVVDPTGNFFGPARSNAITLGNAANLWTAVYATSGVVSPSSAAAKEGVTPLDPQRAMQAVRDTPAVTFDYVAPTRTAEWYDLPDDPEQAEAVLAQRLTAAPLEAAARHQSGFVAEDCDPLFLVGEGQTSPGNTAGILLAALQALDARVTQLEGAPEMAAAGPTPGRRTRRQEFPERKTGQQLPGPQESGHWPWPT